MTIVPLRSVFEKLSVETLEGLEAIISPWLDQVCEALSLVRFTDTEGKNKQIVELLEVAGAVNTQEV
ncbi:MAG: hypothetical protein ACYC3I_00160 [Gemmataceae bacterium]